VAIITNQKSKSFDTINKNFVARLLPVVKIHTWGGLGSQLHALALEFILKDKYPNRRFHFVVHSSGVTKRNIEADIFDENFAFKDDFGSKIIRFNNKLGKMKNFLVKLLFISRFVVNCNNDSGIGSIKLWTVSVRGHYTSISLSRDLVGALWTRLFESSNNRISIDENRYLAIHYRLGDLEKLPNKSPIDAKRVVGIAKVVLADKKFKQINIYSDSIFTSVNNLKTLQLYGTLHTRSLTPIETILECSLSQVFIGTNSKLSIWIAIFRGFHSLSGNTYLPSGLASFHLKRQMRDIGGMFLEY
jgi:hypothetical protein